MKLLRPSGIGTVARGKLLLVSLLLITGTALGQTARLGYYTWDPSTASGLWTLDLGGNPASDTVANGTVRQFHFGNLGLGAGTPVVGDWNGDGHAKVGLFYQGVWQIDLNGDHWPVTFSYGNYQVGDRPVVGDWNGDGRSKVGIFRNINWFLDKNGNHQWDGSGIPSVPGPDASTSFGNGNLGGGEPGDLPIAGRWGGVADPKKSQIGVYRADPDPALRTGWYLDWNGNGNWDKAMYPYGSGQDKYSSTLCSGASVCSSSYTPVIGDWNGSGTSKIGLFQNGQWNLDFDGTGTNPQQVSFGVGVTGAQPIVGRWDPNTVLYMNLGPFPIDYYLQSNSIQGATSPTWWFPNCDHSATLQYCLVNVVLPSYQAQHVTGVRIMFGLNATAGSTPLRPDGTVDETWMTKMGTLFSDLQSFGISHVVLTTGVGEGGAADYVGIKQHYDYDGCLDQSNVDVVWFTDTPFPLIPTYDTSTPPHITGVTPYGSGQPDAYNCAPANPYFVGWSSIYYFETRLLQVAGGKVAVDQFELMQEVNIADFTVLGRLIRDNKANNGAGEDALMQMQAAVTAAGAWLDPLRVTVSTVANESYGTTPGDCLSAYGDSARVIGQSALLAAMNGSLSGFGPPPGAAGQNGNGLPCGGILQGLPVISPPLNAIPNVVDIHAYPCSENSNGSCRTDVDPEVQVSAVLDFTAIVTYWQNHGLVGQTAIIGETWVGPSSTDGCSYGGGPAPSGSGAEAAAGYSASSLPGSLGQRTRVIIPWANLGDTCFTMPVVVNPPWSPQP
jgi:hypothetical protein